MGLTKYLIRSLENITWSIDYLIRCINKMKRLLALLLICGVIGGVGYRLLNSGQKPIEPEKLTGEWQEGEEWAVFNNEKVQIIIKRINNL